jgi:F-type H+-transporting ATPase subunit delta
MSRRVARPYAAALYQVMEKEGIVALRDAEGQLEAVADMFRREPELLRVFEVPSVPPAAKRELIAAIGQTLSLRPEARRLLAALAQHVRLRFLPGVVAALREFNDRREGMVRGRLEMAVAPDKNEVAALEAALERLLAIRVELQVGVRRELLAGFVVRVGSWLFDGSLLAQVRRFTTSVAGE